MNATLKELAELVAGTLCGDGGTAIRGVNSLREAKSGDISFVANGKYAHMLASTKASAVIVKHGVQAPLPSIAVDNPDLAFARVAQRFCPPAPGFEPGVHPTAVVAPDALLGRDVAIGALAVVGPGARIGDSTTVHAQAYVGRDARIGPECRLYPQVVVRERCEIGARVILHAGAVVGSDGFGYVTEKDVHHKIPQTGIVVIEDDVEIGANTAIDRARFGRTVIGRGSKIDNLVQIAHNVVVGEGALIASQAGIAGSTRLGRRVTLAGQVGLSGHIELGDGVIVTAQAGVGKDVPPGLVISGEYAVEMKTHLKRLAALAKLPEALAEIRKLRGEIEKLKNKPEA